jgi:hypothetical protein
MTDEEVIDSFWDAVPDDITWEDLAEGITVTFYDGFEQYSLYTGAGAGFRIRSFLGYSESLERKALALVRGENDD